jgi:hypothetical protein
MLVSISLCALEGTLRHWSWLHLQLLEPTKGYGLFSLYVIHKEGLCPSSGDIDSDDDDSHPINVPSCQHGVIFRTEQKDNTCPFLPWML